MPSVEAVISSCQGLWSYTPNTQCTRLLCMSSSTGLAIAASRRPEGGQAYFDDWASQLCGNQGAAAGQLVAYAPTSGKLAYSSRLGGTLHPAQHSGNISGMVKCVCTTPSYKGLWEAAPETLFSIIWFLCLGRYGPPVHWLLKVPICIKRKRMHSTSLESVFGCRPHGIPHIRTGGEAGMRAWQQKGQAAAVTGCRVCAPVLALPRECAINHCV